MVYVSRFQTGNLLDSTITQNDAVAYVYTSKARRGLSIGTQPTLADGEKVIASKINTAISCQNVQE